MKFKDFTRLSTMLAGIVCLASVMVQAYDMKHEIPPDVAAVVNHIVQVTLYDAQDRRVIIFPVTQPLIDSLLSHVNPIVAGSESFKKMLPMMRTTLTEQRSCFYLELVSQDEQSFRSPPHISYRSENGPTLSADEISLPSQDEPNVSAIYAIESAILYDWEMWRTKNPSGKDDSERTLRRYCGQAIDLSHPFHVTIDINEKMSYAFQWPVSAH